MSMTTYEGRNLPSVFSDISSNSERQEARKKIGQLGVRIVLLTGAFLVAIGLVVVAGLLYFKEHDANGVLQQEVRDLRGAADNYATLTATRDRVLAERRDLLHLLDGPLSDPKIRAGWDAARSREVCLGPADDALPLAMSEVAARCFIGDPAWERAVNERSQTWDGLMRETTETLQAELRIVARAKQAVIRAQAGGGPQPRPVICDQVTGVCRPL